MKTWVLIIILSVPLCAAFGQSKYLKSVDKQLLKADTVKAMVKLNKQIQKHPEEVELYLRRAEIKIDRGDLGPAMVDLNSFCVLNKSCGKAAFLKGVIRYRQHDYSGSIEHLSEYSRKFDDANGWLYLGLAHLQLGNYQIAQNAFQRSLETDSKSYNAAYNAGLAAYQGGDYVDAIKYFDIAITLLPASVKAHIGLGLTQTAMGRFAESNETYKGMLALNPNNGTLLYNIGVNCYNLDQKAKACEYWQKAAAFKNPAADLALERYCQEK